MTHQALTRNKCHRFGMHAGTNQVWTFTVVVSLIGECIVSDLKALTRFFLQAYNEYNKTNIALLLYCWISGLLYLMEYCLPRVVINLAWYPTQSMQYLLSIA